MIGVFGGSGFYSLLEEVRRVPRATPYGDASDDLTLGVIEGREVAFLPRHGPRHTIAPHRINYRANLWLMKEAGVERILAPTAAGSLQGAIRPGDFVICDQFVDRTHSRGDTFFDDPPVAHVSTADPYCPQLRGLTVSAGQELGATVHDGGTVVVIQGPRFSTRAESRWFAKMGWDVINMTQYPEVALARELQICFVNIALITDYDAGLLGSPGIEPVSAAEVASVFASNNRRVRELISTLVPRIPAERACTCGTAMSGAVIR